MFARRRASGFGACLIHRFSRANIFFWTRTVCLLVLCAGPVQAAPLDSSQFESCGPLTALAQDCPDCEGEVVFAPDGQWHGLAQCSRDIRDAWARFGPGQLLDLPGQPRLADLVRDQILSEMSAPDVRFLRAADGRPLSFADSFDADLRPRAALSAVVLINDRGEAYNGMGQTGLAYFLFQFAAQAGKGDYDRAAEDAAFYRLLGRAALAGVLNPVAEGGLTTSTTCALAPDLRCSWYHSVTRRDWSAAAGGTLNQMLHVLRDMAQIDQMAARQGWALDLDLPRAIEAGVNQLFLSGGYQGPGTGPDLADFNSSGRDSRASSAWAYYGYNTLAAAPGRGYFLKNPAKNCSYHAHDVQLLLTILKQARAAGLADRARAAASDSAAMAAFVAALAQPDVGPAEISCSAAVRAKIARMQTSLAR